jgi:hypothetical protein
MKNMNRFCGIAMPAPRGSRSLLVIAMLATVLSMAGCATFQESEKKPDAFERAKTLFNEGNYEAAFRENQRVLIQGRGAADVALFNMAHISAHSLNPKKDYARALGSFRTLVHQHPESPLTEPAKAWIQVLEEHQKIAGEKQKLLEERRILAREKETLSQEKEKLKYTVEKSRQLDMEIEKRRRQTQSR